MKTIFTSIVVSLLASVALFAQGTAFTYQGGLSDGSAPAIGMYDFTFTLYNAATSGGTVGTSNMRDNVSITNGLFTVALDFGAPAFDGNGRWLQIAVRPGGSTGAYTNLSPRQQITSTPYALRAANAATATMAVSVSSVAASNITSGVLNTNRIPNLDTSRITTGVLNTNRIPNLAASKITSGVLDENRIPDLDASKIVSGTLDARLSTNVALLNRAQQTFSGSANNFNGFVGIGTTSPATRLHVMGGTEASSTGGYIVCGPINGLNIALDNNEITARNNGSLSQLFLNPGGGAVVVGTGGPIGPELQFQVAGNAGITGDMGIGTIHPAAPLHVEDSRFDALGTALFRAPSIFGTWLWLQNTSAGGRNWAIISSGSNNGEGAGKLVFSDQTIGVSRMVISTNGNVGIDNSDPTDRLMVGSARCNGSSWINSSDRNLKQDFAPVDPLKVLAKVMALPIQSWSYKAQPGEKHLGPIAQDFHAAFGTGADDKSIATVDIDGVALAAIQGLNQKLEQENSELRARLEKLERLFSGRAGSRTQ